jgi:hypothetical protein
MLNDMEIKHWSPVRPFIAGNSSVLHVRSSARFFGVYSNDHPQGFPCLPPMILNYLVCWVLLLLLLIQIDTFALQIKILELMTHQTRENTIWRKQRTTRKQKSNSGKNKKMFAHTVF